LVTLLLAAISIFAQFERAFDRVWNIEDPERRGVLAALRSALYERGRAFLMLLGLGLMILVIFFAGLALKGVQKQLQPWLPEATAMLWTAAQFAVSVVLNGLTFALLYRFLPKRPVRWRDALSGGMLVAVSWEIGRQVLATYLIGSKYTNAYGVIGSFLAIMLWVYYASTILLLGCEYVQVVGRRHEAAGVGETRPA
jgi:membrane protein